MFVKKMGYYFNRLRGGTCGYRMKEVLVMEWSQILWAIKQSR